MCTRQDIWKRSRHGFRILHRRIGASHLESLKSHSKWVVFYNDKNSDVFFDAALRRYVFKTIYPSGKGYNR
jgi:hypothetical protein